MSNVIDLTRRFDGNLNEISLNTVKVNNGKLAKTNADYLQEVHLGSNLSACYFKGDFTNGRDSFYYDMAWLKIPAGFQYVDYEANGSSIVSTDTRAPLSTPILTPLLMLFDETEVNEESHICDLIILTETNPLGCSLTTKLHSQRVLDPNGFKSIAYGNKPFILFYYNGPLRINPADPNPKGETRDGGYYLIPLHLSEKIIVYYCFDVSKLQQVYDDATKGILLEIASPLAINDEKGIFVTCNAVPKP